MTITVTQAYTNSGGGVPAAGSTYDRHMVLEVSASGFSGTGGSEQNLINLGAGGYNLATGGLANVGSIDFHFLGKRRIVTGCKVFHDSGANGTWEFRGSMDGLTWTALGSTTFTSTSPEVINCSSNTTAYGYYQLVPTSNFTGMAMSQVQFELSGNQYEWGDRTSGSLVVCTASVSMSGGGVNSMFDGDLTANGSHSWWSGDAATGATLQFDFADPVEITAIYSFDTGGSNNGTWKVEKWDGASWVEVCAAQLWDLSTIAGRTFVCTPTGTSTRYRMLGTAGSMNSGPFYQEFGFDITDASVTPSVDAVVATVAVEVISDSDGSNAIVGATAVEVVSDGDGSSATVGFVALEIVSSIALAPMRAFDGGKIYEAFFATQPETLYSEADYDSIFSLGDRVGMGLMTLTTRDFSNVYAPPRGPNNMADGSFGPPPNGLITGGQSGWPTGSLTWEVNDGSFQYISGIKFFGDNQTWPGTWIHTGGYDGEIWALNTAEFQDFIVATTATDPVYGGYSSELDFTPTFFPWNFWTLTQVGPRSGEGPNWPGLTWGPELHFRVYHSVLDGGNRRPDNGRSIKRVTITYSSGILATAPGGVDPILNLIDGLYSITGKHDNTQFYRVGGSFGDDALLAPGEYFQFGFPRKVLMRQMVWNTGGTAEVIDSGGNPTKYGLWQWQASNAPGSGFVDVGSPWHFGEGGELWLLAPKIFDESAPGWDVTPYLYPYWRMVLLQGPAFGRSVDGNLFQIMFNLIDPDNQFPLLEVAFTDDLDGQRPIPTIGLPGNPFTGTAFTDGTDDAMTATPVIIPNLSLTVAFSDGPEDGLTTYGSMYPTTFSQSIAIVKGR